MKRQNDSDKNNRTLLRSITKKDEDEFDRNSPDVTDEEKKELDSDWSKLTSDMSKLHEI